ncbi:hypothetical protein MAC_07429 [Metarhizium acridum CQMa 102]|uniref:Uncharacterized protein n=1 Tax=Metarhizium acridum (strain CQMa 102) TaxID=655827 RepID=E9EC31_METAQ|nr:uncharacterized protein MAC_07429 [Metarhizium acridum CQMa 102]EFY86567.1 hypothetical protein MAC_07429 [Metarhizium acridum CQMa 102]
MSRFFSSSAANAKAAFKRLLGYPLEKLDPRWKLAVETYKKKGGPHKTGQNVADIVVYYPADSSSPVHTSRYNPSDTRPILSVKLKLADGSFAPGTHHIFNDGTGTAKKDDDPE